MDIFARYVVKSLTVKEMKFNKVIELASLVWHGTTSTLFLFIILHAASRGGRVVLDFNAIGELWVEFWLVVVFFFISVWAIGKRLGEIAQC